MQITTLPKDDVKRGEIYYISRGGYNTGSEQQADRPGVIVSNDKNNKNDKLTNEKAEIQNLAIREQRKTLAIENIKKHPFFGGGLGVSNDINDGFIEYFYLDILSKIGFIGFIIFIIPFLFSAFAGRTHIGSDSENIFGFKADCLRIGNRLSFESDSESSRQEAPSFFGKEIS